MLVTSRSTTSGLGRTSPPPCHVIPDTTVHSEKVAVVFNEFDTNNNLVLEPEELRQGFMMLHLNFSAATIADLIAKSDLNKDGVVSKDEFEKFGQKYPAMIDSFYFRLKAHYEEAERDAEIEAAKKLLLELKEREQVTIVEMLEAQQAADQARNRLSAQEATLQHAIDAQRLADANLQESRRDTERAEAERSLRLSELNQYKDREARAASAVSDCKSQIVTATARLANAQSQMQASADHTLIVTKQITEAQTEVERCRTLTIQRQQEVADSRAREQATALALSEAATISAAAAERMKVAEAEAGRRQQVEAELAMLVSRAVAETQHIALRRDEDEAALKARREDEEVANSLRLRSEAAVEEVDRRIVALEVENTAFTQRRRQVEQQEVPLLEQEIRLRSQRDFLEVEEEKLRGHHKSFVTTTTHTATAGAVAAATLADPAAPPLVLADAIAHADASYTSAVERYTHAAQRYASLSPRGTAKRPIHSRML